MVIDKVPGKLISLKKNELTTEKFSVILQLTCVNRIGMFLKFARNN